MEEQGRGEGQAVDAVEHAAMAGQEGARVLDPEIALKRRDREVAEKPGITDDQPDDGGVPPVEGGELGRKETAERRGRRHSATEARDGRPRADEPGRAAC